MLVAVVALAASAVPAWSQDYQLVPLGNGTPGTDCVLPGANTVLDSTPAGDDVNSLGTRITSGADGICDTPLAADDVRPATGITLGGGLPNSRLIIAGTPFANDGICDDTVAAQGDDVVRIPAGQSEPRMIAITAGPDTTVDTTPAGDDLSAGVICPGANLTIDSTTDPGDALPVVGPLCTLCPFSAACITPGTDGILQSTPSGDDILVPFVSSGADGIAQSAAADDDTQVIAVGDGFEDAICVTTGVNGVAETTLCGNGVADPEENGLPGTDCEDGDTTAGDGCNAVCQPEFCGDGIEQPGIGEQCDDGNVRNDDACVVGCQDAFCGDGFRQRGVEECEPPNTPTCDATCQSITPPQCGDGAVDPGEQCDDGNQSNRDDCLNTCATAQCGDVYEHTKGTPPFEECDDGNTAPGDGCSPTCTVECGNGVIDGVCSQGDVGAACSDDADCDTSPGNGVCVGEACDPGAASLCAPGPEVCSNVCQIAACGNGEVECTEECDLGSANGVAGSGCTVACTRNVVGANELAGVRECLHTWTLDSPPQSLTRRGQPCTDGAGCDFDGVVGQCTFRVGVCLNRTGIAACTPGNLVTFDLLRLDISDPGRAAAAEAITDAVSALSPGTATVPDRCRLGLQGKVCSIPDDAECDTTFGAGNGACDLGAGVLFAPPLDGGAQTRPCTPGVDVVVPAGGRLVLRARATNAAGLRDTDALRLVCRP